MTTKKLTMGMVVMDEAAGDDDDDDHLCAALSVSGWFSRNY
jgi:hypothetical protein